MECEGFQDVKKKVKKTSSYDICVLVVSEPFQEVLKLQSWAFTLQLPNYASNVEVGGKI